MNVSIWQVSRALGVVVNHRRCSLEVVDVEVMVGNDND